MKGIRFIDTHGTIRYTDTGDINGKYHREDGPAAEYPNGDKYWYLNGKRHREDGPAIEYTNRYKAWYLNDIKIDVKDNDEFLRIVKLKAFL